MNPLARGVKSFLIYFLALAIPYHILPYMTAIRDSITLETQRRRTPEGFLCAPAVIGRAGVLVYQPTDGAVASAPAALLGAGRPIRVLRPASEVFAAGSMASFAGRPVTNEHSAAKVTPHNFRDHIVGITGSAVVQDGNDLRADLTIYDAAMIDAITAGKCQLSQGYDAQTDWTPGSDPQFGAFDGSFSHIVGNHVAITDAGRSGPGVRILDSKLNEGVTMAKRNFNGVEIEIPDTVVGVVDSYLATATKTAADLSEATGKIAAMEKTIADSKTEIARVTDSAYIDGRVKERAALVDAAKRITPAVVCDGLTDDAIRAAVVLAKGITVDGVDATRGAFLALASAPVDSTSARQIADSLSAGTGRKSAEDLYNEARNAVIANANKGSK